MTDTTTTAATTPDTTPTTPSTPAPPAPRSDAEAALQDQQAPATPDANKAAATPEKKDEPDKEQQKRNRTREYIERLNRENAELRAQLGQPKQNTDTTTRTTTAQPQAKPEEGEPQLADYNFDYAAYQRAHSQWAVNKALSERETSTRQAEATTKQRESVAAYNAKAVEFAEDHDDYFEVVGSMDLKLLTPELQFAIMGHENGPAVAYHLATNEDELWNLASIRADLMPAAVSRLASRLAAQNKPAADANPQPNPDPIPQPPPRISKAPPPAPTVTGRTPSETPPEKLTDDDWYAREKERSRKR